MWTVELKIIETNKQNLNLKVLLYHWIAYTPKHCVHLCSMKIQNL